MKKVGINRIEKIERFFGKAMRQAVRFLLRESKRAGEGVQASKKRRKNESIAKNIGE